MMMMMMIMTMTDIADATSLRRRPCWEADEGTVQQSMAGRQQPQISSGYDS
jgi:hypothetical protein